MTSRPSITAPRLVSIAVCAVAGCVLFQYFGNASRGYLDTASLYWWWISQWLNPRSETEHGWLILGISVWLFWRNLRMSETGRDGSPSRPSVPETAAVPGGDGGRLGEASLPFLFRYRGGAGPVVAMLGALALHAIGFIAQQTRISILAFLLFTWGAVAMADRRWGRAAAFPLAFLVFAIPLNVLDSVGFWLRLWVISASGTLAHALGIDVVRSGTQLFAPDGHFQYDVAAACSGVRSLMALAALSLLIGYLNFRSTSRRGLMLLLCFPLTYLGNLTRICAIIVAAQIGGQRWGERAHDVMGYGIFIIVLGGVVLAAEAMKRWWPEPPPPPERTGMTNVECRITATTTGPGSSFVIRYSSLCAAVVVVLTLGEMAALSHLASSASRGAAGVRLTDDGKDPVSLPAFIGSEWIGRRAEVTTVEREVLPPDTGFSRRAYVSLQPGAHQVFFSIVLSGRDRTSIHRPEICLVGQGWTIRSSGLHVFPGGVATPQIPATLLHTELTERGSNRKLPALVVYWFVSSDGIVATHWERFLRDAWNRLRHGRADRWAYVLMQADAADGDAAALSRMQAVMTGVLPVFMAVEEPRRSL